MRRLTALLLPLLALLLTIPATAAQAPPPASPESLADLTYIAYRQYTSDPNAPFDENADVAFLVTARMYQFGSQDAADSAWDVMANDSQIKDQIPAGGDADAELTTDEPEGLGDRAFATNVTLPLAEDMSGNFRMLFVQDGDALIQITAIAATNEAAQIADDIAHAMLEREAGDGEPEIHLDGTSRGGIWDRFPEADDDALQGLIAFEDQATVPVQ